MRDNIVESAYGAGIFVNDRETGSHNEIANNVLQENGAHQFTGAITMEEVSDAEVHQNTVQGQGSGGFALRLEGGPHTRAVQITDNIFVGSPVNMLYVTERAQAVFVADRNFYHAKQPRFHWGTQEYSFAGWQKVSRQDSHSQVADPALFEPPQISPGTRPN